MDRKTIEFGKNRDNFIIEGWIAYYFIPHSTKIFLDVQENIGAERILKDKRPDEQVGKNISETKQKLKERLKNSEEAFKKYYGINFLDTKNYDFVLDTTNLSLKEVTKKVLKFLKTN